MNIELTALIYDCRTGRHISKSDPTNHSTVRIKTVVQTQNKTHQVAHIYLDNATYAYTAHNLYPKVKPD